MLPRPVQTIAMRGATVKTPKAGAGDATAFATLEQWDPRWSAVVDKMASNPFSTLRAPGGKYDGRSTAGQHATSRVIRSPGLWRCLGRRQTSRWSARPLDS